tara:strand:+ start:304 stop:516 length:213 start_codon:yes stop_codon:yes gene_type:complete
MKFIKKLILLLFISISLACNYSYEGDNKVINDVIKSQNYEGEIEDLIVYALVTIFLFFVVGYIGNKKKKK